jgi:hypothetical protein
MNQHAAMGHQQNGHWHNNNNKLTRSQSASAAHSLNKKNTASESETVFRSKKIFVLNRAGAAVAATEVAAATARKRW